MCPVGFYHFMQYTEKKTSSDWYCRQFALQVFFWQIFRFRNNFVTIFLRFLKYPKKKHSSTFYNIYRHKDIEKSNLHISESFFFKKNLEMKNKWFKNTYNSQTNIHNAYLLVSMLAVSHFRFDFSCMSKTYVHRSAQSN